MVYVFDATNPNNITLLDDIYAGLYHFDIDIDPVTRAMYVASEWYGVLTVDVKNIHSEIYRAKTITGGWCHGSAQAKDRLVEASEGYGIRLFNSSVMQTPTLIKEDTTRGFCRAISLSDSADYVYAWFLTGKRFRVQDGTTLNHVAEIGVDTTVPLPSDYKKSRHNANHIAVIEELPGGQKLIVADVTNPAAPFIAAYRQKNNVRDILFHPTTGDLLACSDDSLMVFNSNNLTLRFGMLPQAGSFFQQFKSFTLSNDTLYVYYAGLGEGIAKYKYDQSNHTLTYLSASPFNMNSNGRIFMANETGYLYIGSTIDSLKTLPKTPPYVALAKYDHGADHIYDNLWGNTDLYFHKGYLFLNEYMGQTTIFGPPTSLGVQSAANSKQEIANVYPNPANNYFTVNTNSKSESVVRIFDASGNIVYSSDVRGEKISVDVSELKSGFYFVSVISEGKETKKKIVIEK